MRILESTTSKVTALGGINIAVLIGLVTLWFNVIGPRVEAHYARKAEIARVIKDVAEIKALILARANSGDKLSRASIDRLMPDAPPPALEPVKLPPETALNNAMDAIGRMEKTKD